MIKTFSKNRNRKWLTFFFIELWLTIFCLKQGVVFGERGWVGYGALATADIVVIYDSDWNPQVDLQAMVSIIEKYYNPPILPTQARCT
jgi:hypothetical protein